MPQISNSAISFVASKDLMAEHISAYQPSKTIVRVEIKIKPIDQMDWLAASTSSVKVFGANQDDTAAIAGIGEALTCKGEGTINFANVFKHLRKSLVPQYPYLQWYGGFAFDASKKSHEWASFGSWHFVMPRFELARDQDKMIFSCNLVGTINKTAVLKELKALTLPVKTKGLDLKVSRRVDHPRPSEWKTQVDGVLSDIAKGRCVKVVLARKTDLGFKETCDPWAMLKSLKKVTPNSYHFAFGFGSSVFLGASPERLYKRYGRMILSEALAGTKPKAAQLEGSLKDLHEHQIVVDEIARGLAPLCDKLDIDKAPQVLSLSNGHHLNTKFQGQLKSGVQDEDILQSLHPTPALGGLPKAFALKTIRTKESFSRGWYAGPLGYVGLDWAEFVVGIRSGLVKGKKLSVFAGAGIVKGSTADDEWQEIENKISNFIKIIR